MVCSNVDVESHKETIKQARVQHLYSRLNGELRIESGEARPNGAFIQEAYPVLLWRKQEPRDL